MTRLCSVLALLTLAGCGGPNHIRGYEPRERNYKAADYADHGEPISDGSLWETGSRGLFADFRAARAGDIVTIRIDESPNASGDASTQMSRSANQSMGVGSLLGFTAALQRQYPDLDPERLLELASQSDFNGDGQTARGSRVQASIAVYVKRVMPNHDLYVEGNKVLLINDEELHIYVSGVVRQQDIAQDNTVASGLIADAQLEFTGRGVLTDNQRQGWFARFLAAINPF